MTMLLINIFLILLDFLLAFLSLVVIAAGVEVLYERWQAFKRRRAAEAELTD